MAKIFVSYSRVDSEALDSIVAELSDTFGAEGIFFDKLNTGGKPWWDNILEKIANAKVFIYLISNDSLASFACRAEYLEAMRLGKHVVLIDISDDIDLDYTDPPLAFILGKFNRLKSSDTNRIIRAVADGLNTTNAEYYKRVINDVSMGDVEGENINIGGTQTYHISYVVQGHEPVHEPATSTTSTSDQKQSDSTINVAYIAGVFAILAAIITGVFGLWQGVFANNDNDAPTPTDDNAVVVVDTEAPEPTVTFTEAPTATSTLTETPTLSVTELNQTIEAQMALISTEEAQTLEAFETATAEQQIAYSQGTSEALTEIAAEWTPTPTIDTRATAEALLTQTAIAGIATATQHALETATQQAIDATVTATQWTLTPTSELPEVSTSGLTASDEVALSSWNTIPVTDRTNADWTPIEREFSLPQGGTVTMVLVPAGCFNMGSTDGDDDEQPVHEICFDQPFWIDKYEVTNEQYGSLSRDSCLQYSSEPNQPRNCVDWVEARNHCESRQSRLPIEAEWEYAARGPDALIYPWGNEWNSDDVIVGTSTEAFPVGSFPEDISWTGALDMSGNMLEWTNSLYRDYPYNENDGREENTDNPSNTPSERRVIRGGYFLEDTPSRFRSAHRFADGPLRSAGDVVYGFRCARDID